MSPLRPPPSTSSPAPVNEFHWLHRQRRSNDVVCVVPPPAHHDEAVHLACDEDEAARADEAQQAGPHEGVLADQPAAGAHRVNLQTHTHTHTLCSATGSPWQQGSARAACQSQKSDTTVFITLQSASLFTFNYDRLIWMTLYLRSKYSNEFIITKSQQK